jgi:hypothetical protein
MKTSTGRHNSGPVFQIAQLPSCEHNTAQHVVNTGFASVPFIVDGAPETMENPKETPKPEEVFRILVDQIREVHYSVLKQKSGLEVLTGYELESQLYELTVGILCASKAGKP